MNEGIGLSDINLEEKSPRPQEQMSSGDEEVSSPQIATNQEAKDLEEGDSDEESTHASFDVSELLRPSGDHV